MRLSPEELEGRVNRLKAILESCILCPRNCKVNRIKGELGYCRTGDKAIIASYGPHFGEERCLVGKGGSGTIFFSWCNLRCVYCQNYEISQLGHGEPVDIQTLAFIIMQLKSSGCENINLVTPTHCIPFWAEALLFIARETEFEIPIVYNTSGYESVEILRLLDGIVDIYMPDFKYWSKPVALTYSRCGDYPERTKEALKEMHRQVGDLEFDERGMAKKGLLVRHLVLPGGLSGTSRVMRFIAKEISPDTYVNIMDQYRPCGPKPLDPPLSRRITPEEYEEALASARAAGIWRIDGYYNP